MHEPATLTRMTADRVLALAGSANDDDLARLLANAENTHRGDHLAVLTAARALEDRVRVARRSIGSWPALDAVYAAAASAAADYTRAHASYTESRRVVAGVRAEQQRRAAR